MPLPPVGIETSTIDAVSSRSRTAPQPSATDVTAAASVRPFGLRLPPWAVGLMGGLVVAAAVAAVWPDGNGSASAPASTTPATTTPPSSLTPAQIYAGSLPSVVVIQTTGSTGAASATEESNDGLGTGVIVNADGSVMTAYHVIDGAETITLTFADGTESAAAVASAEPARDLAVLTPATLPEVVVPAVLGGGVNVGDAVVAIGHQLGLVGSTTSGVVSGLGRSLQARGSDVELEGLIQFDAAVNPGSSGGPLLDAKGRLVGIVTAIANRQEQSDSSNGGFFIGVGFAIPFNGAGGAGDGRGGPGPSK